MKQPRLLVVRGGAIGDFLMTLPAIGALRERWPSARIEILGYPHITELARGRYYADATRSIEARPLAGFFIPHAVLDPGLKEYFGSFEVVISYLFDPDGVFAGNVRRCGVPQVIEASPRPTELPAAAHYCQPLAQLALEVATPRPRLHLTDGDREFAARYRGELPAGTRIVAVHPGSGSEKKNWPAENFATVVRAIRSEWPATAVWVIQGEADEAAVRRLAARLAGVPWQPVRGLTLVELAAVLQRCGLFIGNDSGITHLAAAVGTLTVALFGPASSPIWEPRGANVRVARFGAGDVGVVQEIVRAWWGGSGGC